MTIWPLLTETRVSSYINKFLCYSVIVKKHWTNWLIQDEFYRFSCTGLSYCVSAPSCCLNISKVHVMSGLELMRPEALLQVSYLKHIPVNLVSLALSLYQTVIKTADSEPVHNKWSLLSGAGIHVCVRWGYTLEDVADKFKCWLEYKCVFQRLSMLEKLLS